MTEDQQEKKKYDNTPIIESFVSLSKDGKFLMHRTITTDIKPVTYYEKVLSGPSARDTGKEVDA
jgi:hypothetical protein